MDRVAGHMRGERVICGEISDDIHATRGKRQQNGNNGFFGMILGWHLRLLRLQYLWSENDELEMVCCVGKQSMYTGRILITGCHISQTRSGRTPHANINLDALIIDWYCGADHANEPEGSSCVELAGILS